MAKKTVLNTDRIEELRTARGWTKVQLAEALTLTPGRLTQIYTRAEEGKPAHAPNVAAIAEVFGVGSEEILKTPRRK